MLDDEIFEAWPPEVLKALTKFRQGDVIEGMPLVCYPAHCDRGILKSTIDNACAGGRGIVELEGIADYALITTQTCDLQEERNPPRQPFISVAPVYDVATSGQYDLSLVRKNQYGFLVPLTAEQFQGEGTCWVGDLRLEIPVEKSWLVGLEPIRAFRDESAYQRFAEKLSRRRLRPAIDGRVRKSILKPLEYFIKRVARSQELDLDGIQEFCIRCEPNLVRATIVKLYCVLQDGTDVTPYRGALDKWHLEISPTVPADIQFFPVIVKTSQELRWSEGRYMVPLLDLADYSPTEEANR